MIHYLSFLPWDSQWPQHYLLMQKAKINKCCHQVNRIEQNNYHFASFLNIRAITSKKIMNMCCHKWTVLNKFTNMCCHQVNRIELKQTSFLQVFWTLMHFTMKVETFRQFMAILGKSTLRPRAKLWFFISELLQKFMGIVISEWECKRVYQDHTPIPTIKKKDFPYPLISRPR